VTAGNRLDPATVTAPRKGPPTVSWASRFATQGTTSHGIRRNRCGRGTVLAPLEARRLRANGVSQASRFAVQKMVSHGVRDGRCGWGMVARHRQRRRWSVSCVSPSSRLEFHEISRRGMRLSGVPSRDRLVSSAARLHRACIGVHRPQGHRICGKFLLGDQPKACAVRFYTAFNTEGTEDHRDPRRGFPNKARCSERPGRQ